MFLETSSNDFLKMKVIFNFIFEEKHEDLARKTFVQKITFSALIITF